jgi:hypothetical protein
MSAMAIKAFARLQILLLLPLLLCACVTLPDPETSQENNTEILWSDGEENGATGQTFTARRPRLNGLTFWVTLDTPSESGQSWVTVRLFASPEQASQAGSALFNTHISLQNSGPISVAVPPLEGGAGQQYYLELTPSGSDVRFQGQNLDAYSGGQAYANGLPLEGDLAFRTTYEFDARAALSDLVDILRRSGLLLPLALTLAAPGWLLLDFSGLRGRFDGGEQAALSIGLSLAVIPILMLWTSTLGIRWSRGAVMVVSALIVAVLLWRVLRRPRSFRFGWTGVILAGVFVFSLAVRLMMVRDLVAPAWVDPVHHALITRLILEGGSFPVSYAPYVELGPTVYHAGYHSTQAVFQWLSGMDLPDGMLIFGQVLNAASIFAVYLLTTSLTGDKRAALLAAWIAGLFTPMPAYYVSWGRYTQLAGLLILPVPLAFLKLVLEKAPGAPDMTGTPIETGAFTVDPENSAGVNGQARRAFWLVLNRESWALWGLACLAAAGLLIVHYRAAAFMGMLLLAYSASLLFERQRQASPALFSFLKKVLGSGLILIAGTLILTLPWMGEVIPNLLVPAFSPGNILPAEPFADFSWRLLEAGWGNYTLWLAGLGVLSAILYRKTFSIAVLLWAALLFVLANLGALGLPGGGIINNTSVAITLFMPLALFGGFAFSSLVSGAEWLLLRREAWYRYLVPLRVILVAAALALSFSAARQLFPLVNPTTYLFRAADRPALAWIEQNIPPGEPVLINPFNWGYGLCAGSDGGAWISSLSGRATFPPPVIYGFGEPSEVQRINSLCAEVFQYGSDPDGLWELLRAAGIRYVYTGARGGPISATALQASPLFDILYAGGGVYVFQTLGW